MLYEVEQVISCMWSVPHDFGCTSAHHGGEMEVKFYLCHLADLQYWSVRTIFMYADAIQVYK